MGRIEYCPVVGGFCNKPENYIGIQKDTYFLAEPFRPQRKRKRRERAIKIAEGSAEGQLFRYAPKNG